MAHSIYLSPSEMDLIKERDAGVSHCPNSNISIRSGLFKVHDLMDKGVKVGLGTDVAGGNNFSILNAIRYAISVANVNSFVEKESERQLLTTAQGLKKKLRLRLLIFCVFDLNFNSKLSFSSIAFYLATVGGAKVVGLEDKIGSLEVGKEFDALLIDCQVPNSPFDVFESDTLETKFNKFIFLGDDRNITKIYVQGKLVHSL